MNGPLPRDIRAGCAPGSSISRPRAPQRAQEKRLFQFNFRPLAWMHAERRESISKDLNNEIDWQSDDAQRSRRFRVWNAHILRVNELDRRIVRDPRDRIWALIGGNLLNEAALEIGLTSIGLRASTTLVAKELRLLEQLLSPTQFESACQLAKVGRALLPAMERIDWNRMARVSLPMVPVTIGAQLLLTSLGDEVGGLRTRVRLHFPLWIDAVRVVSDARIQGTADCVVNQVLRIVSLKDADRVLSVAAA